MSAAQNETRSASTDAARIFSNIAEGLETGSFAEKFSIGLTLPGSEHGESELVGAAQMAARDNPALDIVLIGGSPAKGFKHVPAADLEAAHKEMERLLGSGEIGAALTLHYNFPVGVGTVGRVVTPARGRSMLIATTTGTADLNRYKAMLLNAIAGVAVAKALGLSEPSLGLVNIDGIALVEKALTRLRAKGYALRWAESARADGGLRLRGNDLLQGLPDVAVCDTLTGNLLVKFFSSFASGGDYEALGFGYGPCAGSGYPHTVGIISRASGAPVIAQALSFVAACAAAGLPRLYEEELAAARKAGLDEILAQMPGARQEGGPDSQPVAAPPRKVVSEGISGIDVIEIEQACQLLWKEGIYAESGMGCTGPVILVAAQDKARAIDIVSRAGYTAAGAEQDKHC